VLSGPYRAVRHPIYSGFLLGMIGFAVQQGYARSFVGVLFCGLSFWLKARAEERFMMTQFGDEYVRYRSRVKSLVPLIF
jgi:protein-S-isoprenylcysteine O-methyltransferase Ste14